MLEVLIVVVRSISPAKFARFIPSGASVAAGYDRRMAGFARAICMRPVGLCHSGTGPVQGDSATCMSCWWFASGAKGVDLPGRLSQAISARGCKRPEWDNLGE